MLPIVSASHVYGQSAPDRAVIVAQHLKAVKPVELFPGVSGYRTAAPNGVELIVMRVDLNLNKFKLVQQYVENGNWVDEFGLKENGVVAINGGFFRIDKNGKKIPVGLLRTGSKKHSDAWKKSGGYLAFKNSGVEIIPTLGNKIPTTKFVLQSKPTLIEPGGKWAMNTNRAIPKNRTLLCQISSGEMIILTVVSGGMSLYEAGWLMRDQDVGGFFGCDSALAMDGGGSTQIWVKLHPELSSYGDTAVQNGIVISKQ